MALTLEILWKEDHKFGDGESSDQGNHGLESSGKKSDRAADGRSGDLFCAEPGTGLSVVEGLDPQTSCYQQQQDPCKRTVDFLFTNNFADMEVM